MIEIPGYTLLRQVGQGGMAAVYLAVQQSLGREVALKVLSSTLAKDADASERFLREARLAASLHHPHIITIHDVGVHDGVAYIAMEFEPGGTVSLVDGEPMDVGAALGVVRDIASALDYAHGKGVVHRDIKPDNILRRANGTCLLSDFGIARVIETESVLTREGTSVGTPQYMSPEQLRGDKVDGRTDLYSLGVVLYQLLTGNLPYAGSDSWGVGMQHISAPIPRLPPAVARVQPLVDGLMAKDAGDRPQTGAEVMRRIDALKSGVNPALTQPLIATPPTLRRPMRWPWLAAGAVVMAIVLGWIARTQFERSKESPQAPAATIAPSNASVAVLPFENLSEDKANAYFAIGIQDEILTRLAGIRDLKVISRTSTEQYASRPPNLRVVGEQLGVTTVLEGSVQKSGDMVHINVQLIDARTDSHLWAESYDRNLRDIFGVQRDIAEKVAEALKAKLLPEESARVADVPTRDTVAYDLYLRATALTNRGYGQDVMVPKKDLPPAIALFEQALARDPSFALAAAALARAHMHMYFIGMDRTQERLAAAKAAGERAVSLQPTLGEAHFALGLYHYWGHRNYADALRELSSARKALPNSAEVETMFAAIARRQGQWDDAIAGFRRAAVLDPRNATSLDELALSYFMLRRYAEADRAFAQAAAVAPDPVNEVVSRGLNTLVWKGELAPLRNALATVVPGSDPHVANANLFFLLEWRSRDYAAAIKATEASTASVWSDQNNVVLPRQLYLAWAYQAAGNSAKSEALYAELRSQMLTALKERPDDADLHLALGFANAGLGLKQEAIREGIRATNLVPVSRDSNSGPAYVAWLAQLHVRVGEDAGAIDLLEQLFLMPAGIAISPALLKLDPAWDPLRDDPRFKKLVEGPSK